MAGRRAVRLAKLNARRKKHKRSKTYRKTLWDNKKGY